MKSHFFLPQGLQRQIVWIKIFWIIKLTELKNAVIAGLTRNPLQDCVVCRRFLLPQEWRSGCKEKNQKI